MVNNMEFIELRTFQPVHDSVHLYSGSTPPSITLEGDAVLSYVGLYFKWFSTNPKKDPFSGYHQAALGFVDDIENNNGANYNDAKDHVWTSARIGTQWVTFFCKDQLVTSVEPDGGDMEAKLSAITRQGIQGGKKSADMTGDGSDDVHELKIHVVGAIVREPILDGSSTADVQLNFFVGGECRVDPDLAHGDEVNWGSDNDDELVYKLTYNDGGGDIGVWDSSVDTLQYRVTDIEDDPPNDPPLDYEGLPMLGKMVSQAEITGRTYKLSVSKGSNIRTKTFTLTSHYDSAKDIGLKASVKVTHNSGKDVSVKASINDTPSGGGDISIKVGIS